ncbi:MAG TPA: hypothetical protein VI547_06960 [Anaerolineales bacterium]|nr:hypothetical protein [Anaerolineales bacterium]HLF01699.1 hypothetical protein [Anaerolineales bacterium]
MQQSRPPFYKQVWFQIGAWPAALFLIWVGLQVFLIHSFTEILIDLLALGLMFVLGLALASQYVLPVQTLKERKAAFDRMISYVGGAHGPIVFVREGRLVSNEEELKRRGPGAILVDGSSGVILEQGRKFSRAEGPGLVFTAPTERVAAVVDLRKQVRSRPTPALSRDGIEIVVNVSVTFGLNPGPNVPPHEVYGELDVLGQTMFLPRYQVDPENAFKAHYGFVVSEQNQVVRWIDLPIRVAAEYTRDEVNRYLFDSLFQPGEPGTLPIAKLQSDVKRRVEESKLLKDRGIKIYGVSVSIPALPEEVGRRRADVWAARWKQEAKALMDRADVEDVRIKELARAQAQAELVERFRECLTETFANDGTESRHDLVQGFLDAIGRVANDDITPLVLGDSMRYLPRLRRFMDLPTETDSENKPAKVLGEPTSPQAKPETTEIEDETPPDA